MMKEQTPLSLSSSPLYRLAKFCIVTLILCGLSGCDTQSQQNHEAASEAADEAATDPPIDVATPVLSLLRFEDHRGSTLSLGDLSSRYIALMLGFTQCPDVCPTGLMNWNRVTSAIKREHSKKIQFVFLTVDPKRDTQDVLARYVPHFNPEFIGLRTDPATQSAALRALHGFARKVPSATPGQYTIDHTAAVFLIDLQGYKVDEISYSDDVETIVRRLEKIFNS